MEGCMPGGLIYQRHNLCVDICAHAPSVCDLGSCAGRAGTRCWEAPRVLPPRQAVDLLLARGAAL